MTKIKFLIPLSLFLVIALSTSSCKYKKSYNDTQYVEEIGWSITPPSGWKVVTNEEMTKLKETGKKIASKFTDEEINIEESNDLISFRKNMFNMFTSQIQPHNEEEDGNWEEFNQFTKQLIFSSIATQGVTMDSSATSIETIDGIDFLKYEILIYGMNDKVAMHQVVYNGLINGNNLAIQIIGNNEEHVETMVETMKESKFEKR